MKQIYAGDEHSPFEFRVKVCKVQYRSNTSLSKGPLANMDSFAKDFNCPKGSAMNPAKKCQVG